ncbi:P-loop containing nucleoside triphosphate hydrolase protein [Basidiobolus meristosporus CBS 931.73]|uniref:p-loop containing nucleoside triphosphate hydrolase protein n=1 Tax=Basidiobolus meristosporus CBS 931.73 TaxID=1314790 RepID=A0A1Y1ZDV9_9FUNG|nr:P-loop containing nucleoside triphosphate hydrolase protein [Basidiobolus meristosporus CBS 931.73]|eukprot:ORY08431.1 P-loop containing nucleoside triphosphate hydrolase protein [Basidiobolus meristosporus CBS 931.73]
MLSTGSERIDQQLEGGLFSQELIEVSGPPGTGKTQLALQMTGLILAEDHTACVAYLDISRNFSLSRINEIVHSRGHTGMDVNKLAARIKYSRCSDLYSFMDFLEAAKSQLKQWGNCRLLVIDSITSIFSSLIGVSYIKGRAMMYSAFRTLQDLAREHNLVVLIVNSAVGNHSNLERGSLNTKPALGGAWSNLPYVQIFLTRGRQNEKCRINCQILKSLRSDPGSIVQVELNEAGLC